jgi:tRNA1(Val) A37 N6-methylase TrmN6
LGDVLAGCAAAGLGALRVLPVAPRAGRDATLVLVQGRAQGRAALRLHAPLVLHAGAAHDGDRDSHTAQVSALLRDAAALDWPERPKHGAINDLAAPSKA